MKSNKLMIIFLPAFALFMCYVALKDFIPKGSSQEKKLDDKVFDVPVNKDPLPKTSSEVYKKKWRREEQLARKVENSDNFFADEVKKDPDPEQTSSELSEPLPEKKEESKPKVVVVYKERPVEAKVSAPVVKEPEPAKEQKKVRRFLSGDLNKGNMGKGKQDTGGGDTKPVINVRAVIQYDQNVINGSDITIRLREDLVLASVTIPQNTFVTGRITFGDQRASIVINSVAKNNITYPVNLKAYAANDGVEGIAIPSATNQQISNDLMNATVQSATQKIASPFLNRSASSVGTRKANEQTVIVKSGYELILKN